ncbi:hypothetical protein IGJ55_001112 [Enterococcus sp. AZ170]
MTRRVIFQSLFLSYLRKILILHPNFAKLLHHKEKVDNYKACKYGKMKIKEFEQRSLQSDKGVSKMSGIKSSLNVAGSVSEQFSQAASGFSSVNEASSKAERTTVSGNNNAKNSLASMHRRGQRLSNAIARDGNNIHSVAKEFSIIDQKIKKSFDLPLFSPSFGGGKRS